MTPEEAADWLLDAVACATQDRRFLRGDPAYDAVAGEAILLNGAKAITRFVQNVEGAADPVQREGHGSESRVQSIVRLEAGRIPGLTLWRNNVGVLTDKTGRPVRYGLANDTKELNEKIKSHDLIGWRTITITPEMVGKLFAQFVSRECKEEDWTPAPPTNKDKFEHEQAQRMWSAKLILAGGDAKFVTGEGSFS